MIVFEELGYSIENILNYINTFYKTVMEREIAFWKNSRNEHKDKVLAIYKEIEKLLVDKDVFLIRIGWGVGEHAMSFNLLKDVNDIYDPKTRRLFACKHPVGWALLKRI